MSEVYGCNTRSPGYKGPKNEFLVQDGYYDFVTARKPRYRIVPNRNSRECKYDRWQIDHKCAGCESEREEK